MTGFLEKLFGTRRKSAASDPTMAKAEALKNRGNEALANGELKAALVLYAEAIELCPVYAEAHNNLGQVHARLGNTAEAEHCYVKALVLKSDLAPAHVNLGVLLQQSGRPEEATACFERALRLPRPPLDAYIHLAGVFHARQRYDEGLRILDRALAVAPNEPIVHVNLGIFHRELGRLAEAEADFRRAIDLNPDHPVAHNELGNLQVSEGMLGKAEQSFRAALACSPDYPDAQVNLGLLLEQTAHVEEAEQCFRDALRRNENFPEALNNLGNLLMKQRRFEEAERCLRRALALRPDSLDCRGNLAYMLQQAGRYEEAEALYRQILADAPDHHKTYGNLGFLYAELKRFDEAESACRHALALDPTYVPARRDLAYILLSQGRFGEGWPLHEARYDERMADKRYVVPLPPLAFPQWRGEPLAGRSLLIWYEQGFGDEIQFCRYASLLKRLGATRIGLVCTRPLRDLLASLAGADRVYCIDDLGELEAHDYWALSMSVPLHVKTTLDTIPNEIPYLFPPPERMTRWRERLPAGPRVGLVWKGNSRHVNDARRSLPGLPALAPLWKIEGVSFISLQKGSGEDEARHPPPDQLLMHVGSDMADFADTAAIVSQLDLVICVDTAIAHLAGALAKPCWVLLPYVRTDWRWLQGRTDSPWYPGVLRLFRQNAAGDWQSVIEQVADALRDFLSRDADGDAPLHWKEEGNKHFAKREFAEAERCYRRALQVDPSYGEALNNLGCALKEMGRPDEAERVLIEAVAAAPDLPEAPKNLGDLYRSLLDFEKAEQAYRQCVELVPDSADALNNLGVLLNQRGRFDEAERLYRAAIERNPALVAATDNLCTLLMERGRIDQAEDIYRRFVAAHPTDLDGRSLFSLFLLRFGKFAEGWMLHEARYDPAASEPVAPLPRVPYPQWRGEPLEGKSMLVWYEQGFGDEIQFGRYVAELKKRGARRVDLVCRPQLARLFGGLKDVDVVYAAGSGSRLPDLDYWALPMSLPLHCRTAIDTVPAELPYLSVPHELVRRWRARLTADGLRVGLVWKGNVRHHNDVNRSLPGLKVMAPLWNVGARFFSLQKLAGEDEAIDPPPGQPLTHLGAEIEDFADMAAIVSQMDLVICVDTAVAHLAGALGKSCWLLLPYTGTDWRWLRDRTDSPWYPGVMRLFRQRTPGDWATVIGEVATALDGLASVH